VKRPVAIEAPVAIVLAVALVMLGAIGLLAYRSLDSIVSSVREEAQPDMRLVHVKALLANLDDARNSVNAYNITSDTGYLSPYFESIASIDDKLYVLRQMPGNDSTATQLIDSLEELVARKFEVLDAMLKLRDDVWVDEALRNLAVAMRPQTVTRVKQVPVQEAEEAAVTTQPEEEDVTLTVVTIPTETKEPKGIRKIWDRIFGSKDSLESEPEPVVVSAAEPEELPATTSPQPTVTTTESVTIYPDVRLRLATMRAEEKARLEERRQEELVLAARDHMIGDSIRVVVAAFERAQQNALATKTAAADALAVRTTRSIATFGIVAALLLVIAFGLTASALRRNRAYNRAMAEARKRAENLANSKQEFLANMSHELRTPLHAISGFSESLLTHMKPSPQREQVETIHKASQHLGGIINDILDLSKLDAGKLKLEDEPVDLHELLEEVKQWLEPAAAVKRVDLTVTCSDTVPNPVAADKLRLKQVLLNVAGNAVKFTDQGTVSLAAECDDRELRITISDTGIGIPADKISSIFEGFVQAEATTTKRFGGTGLGLTITKKLVDLMGGHIDVRSAPDEGSTFVIRLPLRQTAADHADSATGDRFDLSHLRILAADDEPFNRKLLETMLGPEVDALHVVDSGEAVLAALEVGAYDVLLLDLRMPGMGGIEVMRALNGNHPDLKVLALTAVTQKEELDVAGQAGITHFLGKPFDRGSLFRKVAELVGQTPSDEADEPPFSLAELRHVANGDERFVREMTQLFIKSTEEGIQEITQARDAGDWRRVRDVAHRIAPSCLHMKADDLYALLKSIEAQADSSEPSGAGGTINQAVVKARRTLTSLRRAMAAAT
jgi:signal transduction histidine kinase/HPt (histidine-containing phosphotransfer) domain-containing protein